MGMRKPISAFAAALALWAGTSDEGSGQPRLPGPPMRCWAVAVFPDLQWGLLAGRGPRGASAPPVASAGCRPPAGMNGLPRPPAGMNRPGQAPGAISGLGRPAGIGPSGMNGMGRAPGAIGGSARPRASAPAASADATTCPALAAWVLLPSPVRLRGIPRPIAVNRQALSNQGNLVRNNFNHHDCFHGNWWGRHRRRLAGGAVGRRGGSLLRDGQLDRLFRLLRLFRRTVLLRLRLDRCLRRRQRLRQRRCGCHPGAICAASHDHRRHGQASSGRPRKRNGCRWACSP